ncbi:hypothetical protein BU17DRAFT_85788 [Hysterangium stoloniferum]|nr:hypothetical protein BU17DRAFT_85788 [Hysterangium stoloniferum]
MGRTEQQLLKEGHDGSGSEADSHQGIESSCSSPFAKLPMELIIVIVGVALRDFWTACSLSKAIRGCIPAIFFHTIVLCPPYRSANQTPKVVLDYSDMENIFITIGTDDDKLILYDTQPKHLCIQLLGMSDDLLYRSLRPLQSSLTHLIIQVHLYNIWLFFYYLNPLSPDFPLFHCRELETLVFPAESSDVLEEDFEEFLESAYAHINLL